MSSSLHITFGRAASRKSRPAPFSIRLSEEEKAQLSREAAVRRVRLGTYIRSRLFDKGQLQRSPVDYALLGQLLAALGNSELASSLCLLAVAAEQGALPVDETLENDLKTACEDVREMRATLVSALGLRES